LKPLGSEVEPYEDEGGVITKKMAGSFCDLLDNWLFEMHEKSPLLAILNWIGVEKKDIWAKWSNLHAYELAFPKLTEMLGRILTNEPADENLKRLIESMIYEVLVGYVNDRKIERLTKEDQISVLKNLTGLIGTTQEYTARFLYRRLTGRKYEDNFKET
jgi:hypothetical protein